MSQRNLKLVTIMIMELGKNTLSYYSVPFINFVFLFKSIQISVKKIYVNSTYQNMDRSDVSTRISSK
jgi:hypothetical protein